MENVFYNYVVLNFLVVFCDSCLNVIQNIFIPNSVSQKGTK